MPMQELVVPVFEGRALLNEMKPLCVVGGRWCTFLEGMFHLG